MIKKTKKNLFNWPLTFRRGLADQIRDPPLQPDHSALQHAGPVTDRRQVPLQLLQDAHGVSGQIRELSEQRAQAEAAHVHQVLQSRLLLQPPARRLANIFGKYRPFAKRHDEERRKQQQTPQMFKLYSSGPSPSGWPTDACFGSAGGGGGNSAAAGPAWDELRVVRRHCFFSRGFLAFFGEEGETAAAAVQTEAAPVS